MVYHLASTLNNELGGRAQLSEELLKKYQQVVERLISLLGAEGIPEPPLGGMGAQEVKTPAGMRRLQLWLSAVEDRLGPMMQPPEKAGTRRVRGVVRGRGGPR